MLNSVKEIGKQMIKYLQNYAHLGKQIIKYLQGYAQIRKLDTFAQSSKNKVGYK